MTNMIELDAELQWFEEQLGRRLSSGERAVVQMRVEEKQRRLDRLAKS